jgi:hypothetical protein
VLGVIYVTAEVWNGLNEAQRLSEWNAWTIGWIAVRLIGTTGTFGTIATAGTVVVLAL